MGEARTPIPCSTRRRSAPTAWCRLRRPPVSGSTGRAGDESPVGPSMGRRVPRPPSYKEATPCHADLRERVDVRPLPRGARDAPARYRHHPWPSLGHIAGYSVGNDVSEREFQPACSAQWDPGKSAETFNPQGPWPVTADEVADPQSLSLRLAVNGEVRQDGKHQEHDLRGRVSDLVPEPVHGAASRRRHQHRYPAWRGAWAHIMHVGVRAPSGHRDTPPPSHRPSPGPCTRHT